ncbi:MAG: DUF1801 domain-containing protein [Bacteroidota bacterium]
MHSKAKTPDDYIKELPEERQSVMSKLREVILKNLPKDIEEVMNYGMIGYVIPHSVYPDGYHCDPKLPLPFFQLASQKNYIAVYHMGLYADPKMLDWFKSEYPKHCKRKLDMGKSCIRFKKMDDVPYELIGELVAKMDAQRWLEIYESQVKK